MSKETKAITFRYRLRDLPTVQHRAGLGGLAFLLKSLEEDGKFSRDAWSWSGDGLQLNLTKENLAVLFELLYQGAEVRRQMSGKPKGDFQEIEVQLEGGKTLKKYEYKDQRPAGAWLTKVGYGKPWLELWQDSIWSTLRDKPASRAIYTGSTDKLVSEFWKAFEAVEKGKSPVLELASALYIGGRSKSSEEVSFDGPPAQVFLLHFAHALAQPFKVVGLDSLGKRTYPGLVWVYPEPRELEGFVVAYRAFLGQCTETDGREDGRRVSFYQSTRVVMPQEAGLAVLEMALSTTRTNAISGAFCAQLEKQGNNVNLLGVAHIRVNTSLIRDYLTHAAPITNFALRRLVLTNLLSGVPLSQGVAKLLSLLPPEAVLPQTKDGHAFSRSAQTILESLKS